MNAKEKIGGFALSQAMKYTSTYFRAARLKYLTAISRKPNAFKYIAFFKELPIVWQEYFNRADYDDSKKMLGILTPILLDGKLDEATIAMEVYDVHDADEFLLIYRNLTEPVRPPVVKTRNTPEQMPYKNDLSVYGGLIGGAK